MEQTKIWRVGRNDRLSRKEVEGERGGRILEDLWRISHEMQVLKKGGNEKLGDLKSGPE